MMRLIPFATFSASARLFAPPIKIPYLLLISFVSGFPDAKSSLRLAMIRHQISGNAEDLEGKFSSWGNHNDSSSISISQLAWLIVTCTSTLL